MAKKSELGNYTAWVYDWFRKSVHELHFIFIEASTA